MVIWTLSLQFTAWKISKHLSCAFFFRVTYQPRYYKDSFVFVGCSHVRPPSPGSTWTISIVDHQELSDWRACGGTTPWSVWQHASRRPASPRRSEHCRGETSTWKSDIIVVYPWYIIIVSGKNIHTRSLD